MKKLLFPVLAIMLLGISAQSFSQTTLWAGYQVWSGAGNNLYGYDTIGGIYTSSSTLALTSTAGAVMGVHGLSVHPSTEVMYVLYQQAVGTPPNRRLGTVDLTTGLITDIGAITANDITDITFYGQTLIGTGGQFGTKECYIIDITDASSTTPGNFSGAGNDHSVVYDFYADRLLRHHISSGNLTDVDTSDFSETVLGSPVGWIHAITMKNDSTLIYTDGFNLRDFNLNTGVSSAFLGTAGGQIMALSFEKYPLYTIVNGPTTFCSNDSSLLSLNESGTTYQWYLDGAPISGATDSTWYPIATGTYYCDVDGSLSISVQITVLPAPVASFTAIPNPVDLGVDPSGQIAFTNTSTGGDGGYWWDFDNGFTSTVENPVFPFTTAGSYNITFIITDTLNGCMDTAWVTVVVINSTGISELDAKFNVYPVPANDVVNVSLLSGSGIYTVDFMDLNGRKIAHDRIASGEKTIQFDLSKVESGIYLIKVYNSEEEGYFKVMKR